MCQQLYTSTIQNPNTKITCNTNGLVNIILGFPFEGILIDWQIIDALCWPHFRFRHKQMMFLQLGKELVNFQKLWNPKSNFQHLKRNTKKFPAFSSPSPPSHLTPQASSLPDTKKGYFWRKVQRLSKGCLFLRCAANFWCLTIEGEDAPIFLGLAFHWDFRHQTLPKSFVYSEQKSYVEANILKYFVNLRLVKRYSEGQLEIGNQFLLHR